MARSRARNPSASTVPCRAAMRSASEMAAAIHVALVPATNGPIPETSPPAPRRPINRPSSPSENDTGPRFDTITTSRSTTDGRGYLPVVGSLHSLRAASPTVAPGPSGATASGQTGGPMRLVAAPDKLRGTATAQHVAAALARVGERAGWECVAQPVAD